MRNRIKEIICLILLFIINTYAFSQTPFFSDVAEEKGVEIVHVAYNLMGGGVAFFDYNNDGWQDIFATGGVKEDLLFRNNGDGTYTNISRSAGIIKNGSFESTSVITGDINNDGFRDIFITTTAIDHNILFLNNGNGTFSEISFSAGIKEMAWSMGASFGDYNLDGYLDIYVINYIDKFNSILDNNGLPIGFAHECYENYFYINNGDNTFTESAELLGVNNTGCGLAVSFSDINSDAVPDIYIANDFGSWITPNVCYVNNQPDLGFEDVSNQFNLDVAVYGMGIAIGDYNSDSFLDYYVTNLGKNVLLKNNGDNTFSDLTDIANVASDTAENGLNSTSWGTAFLDYDNDGLEDLFVSNGYIPAAEFIETSNSDPNKLYRNNGDGTFNDISIDAGVDDDRIARGFAFGDHDNDGDIDLLVPLISNSFHEKDDKMLLYENNLANNNSYLQLKLEGVDVNRDAFGSRVYAYHGTNVWVREISGGASYASQSSSVLHFGLGNVDHLDSLEVIWTGGSRQVFYDVEVDRVFYLKEGNSLLRAACMDIRAFNYNAAAEYNYACTFGDTTSVETGLFDIDYDNKVYPYPHPVNKEFSINLPDNISSQIPLNFSLYDIYGHEIFTSEFIKNQTIDVSHLPKGLYFFEITSKSKREKYIGKLTKQ